MLELPSDAPYYTPRQKKVLHFETFWSNRLSSSLYRFAKSLDIQPWTIVHAAFSTLVARQTNSVEVPHYLRVVDDIIKNPSNPLPKEDVIAVNVRLCEHVSLLDAILASNESFTNSLAELSSYNSSSEIQRALCLSISQIEYSLPEEDQTYQLSLHVALNKTNIFSRAKFCAASLTIETVKEFLRRLETLLSKSLREPEKELFCIELTTDAERRRILQDWNQESINEIPMNIVEGFSAQVLSTPDSVAVADEYGGLFTYVELNERSNYLANHLRSLGVGYEDRCAIMVDRTVEMPVAILGILKAGGAYVPIDETTPLDRTMMILRESGAKVVITDMQFSKAVPIGSWNIVRLDKFSYKNLLKKDPKIPILPNSLAYILYTSGSTGRPKCVMIEHRNVTAFVRGAQHFYQLTPKDVFLQLASVAFDVTTFELFACLLSGCRLYIPSKRTKTSIARLRRLMIEQQVTIYMGTPSILEFLNPSELPSLRLMAVGGEPVSSVIANNWRYGRRFLNSYGPTETTVAVIAGDCNQDYDRVPPIGRPMPNHFAYVLDTDFRPVSVGEIGQLYIAGPGLGRGYLGDPVKTAEVFVPNPFGNGTGDRMYYTGDLVRWLGDGRLVYVGRVDRQVKISGARVELGEVEANLRALPMIKLAVVKMNMDELMDKRLIAYVLLKEGEQFDENVIREQLRLRLPRFMIPNHIVCVDKIPLTVVGKIDWELLQAKLTEKLKRGRASISPSSDKEIEIIKSIVVMILGHDDFAIEDDLLHLGINSLQVVRIIAQIEKTFGLMLEADVFFETPSVMGLLEQVIKEKKVN